MALGNVDKWTTSDANCLDITDMDCAPAPAPLDATALQVCPADEDAPDHDEEPSSDDEEWACLGLSASAGGPCKTLYLNTWALLNRKNESTGVSNTPVLP